MDREVAGTRLFVESARVKRRRCICLELYRDIHEIWCIDDSGTTMTMEQVVTRVTARGFHVESSGC